MHLDLKLLRDLGPYSVAYGHMMSNFIYRYRHTVARYEVLGGDDNLRRAQYYERVLLSFLTTKHLTYSQGLVKRDMGITDEEIATPELSAEDKARVYDTVNAYQPFIREVEEEMLAQQKYKDEIEIEAESWMALYPDSPIGSAMQKILAGTGQRADMALADSAFFSLVLFKRKEGYSHSFAIKFWRKDCSTGRYTSKGWIMNVYDARDVFPEIMKLEWVDNKA